MTRAPQLHVAFWALNLGRHYRDMFCLTQRGQDVAKSPSAIFQQLVPFYILQVDHASYGQFADRPMGNWDTWLNVINVEVENGASETALFEVFYGRQANWENHLWRELAAFSHCVLKPLEWSGLLSIHQTMIDGQVFHMCFKTPLWRSVLVLDTDDMLTPAQRH